MEVQLVAGEPSVVRVSGEVDFSNVGRLKDAIDEALRRSPHGFVLDLSPTSYVDSAGVAAIISAYQRLAADQGRLSIVITNRNVRRILDLVRLDMLAGLSIHTDLESAAQAIATPEQPTSRNLAP
jgi:anti-sigma B factor antagonist